jgi:hypothetical protein
VHHGIVTTPSLPHTLDLPTHTPSGAKIWTRHVTSRSQRLSLKQPMKSHTQPKNHSDALIEYDNGKKENIQTFPKHFQLFLQADAK